MRRAIVLLAAVGLAAGWAAPADADLVAGDVNVIGYRAGTADAIAFVTWVNLADGAQLHFTDSGFFSDGTMRDSEEIMSWTAPTGGVAAGTVVVISSPASPGSADAGAVTGALSGLSTVGDQVFVGTTQFPTGDSEPPGTPYSGGLLYGLNFFGVAVGWDTNATTNNTSALPASLNGLHRNIALTGEDNGQYTGTRIGLSIDAFKALIHDPGNWTQSNAPVFPLSSTDFTIANVPEASAFFLGGLACCAVSAMAAARKRRACKASSTAVGSHS